MNEEEINLKEIIDLFWRRKFFIIICCLLGAIAGLIYTMKFVYCYSGSEEPDAFVDLPRYEATIKLKINENSKYSKYKIISLSEGKLLNNNNM